ncbi:bifunctional (p)ppGpp synthetase/guanosine-3',5'-bis(diphosphate) 3'-pyrophosphohydrolase [Endozoicomonas sp. SM1973]|uniref:Bifunctional (P)ppGpp synthetase/guanosine-3',5'-bis(Diphosphate) 3'-pyrophosphohydrolase n=2 Tax=Spartinivicinus marinus TaxID=2994442 RepID=A0A853IH51_9GAMM|nr:bifunctional (p)ppGpp synthetase/guanosine-3',5'-bis(diphosphate) 3'-pyrophosphohydrolase [Spartinivicinus marinus]
MVLALIEQARVFATEAHASINQRRRFTDDPYIVHPEAVAKLVAEVTDEVVMIAAAWLHDVVEDTPVTLSDLRNQFGEDITQLVYEVSKVSGDVAGDKVLKKALDRDHFAQASPRGKTIKLADMIDNLTSVVQSAPEFAKSYVPDKALLLPLLKEGDNTLYIRATTVLEQCERELYKVFGDLYKDY